MKSATVAKLGCLVVGGLLLAAPSRRTEAFGDPIGNYNFRVEIDGVDAGHFTGLDGLSIEQEVIEYQNGDDPLTRKRPGRLKYGDITLKRGYVASTVLNDWIEAARLGKGDIPRANLRIVLESKDGRQQAEWLACHVFPKRLLVNPEGTIPGDRMTVTEEVTFAVEELIFEPTASERDCAPRPPDPPRDPN
jgi:phage tail-like protein